MNPFKRRRQPFPESNSLSLEQQAHAWVRRLTSGIARGSDAQALAQWCARSPAHAEAFKKAHSLWRDLGPAAQLAGAHDPELAALRAAPYPVRRPSSVLQRPSRRIFLGGALAASAAAGVALLYPPLDLWPAGGAWRADYRTATGEQRQLALAPDVTVAMNTRSSIALQSRDGATTGIELLDGEVAVDTVRRRTPFAVMAGGGRVQAMDDARFELRHTDGGVCVTCINGLVRVALANRQLTLRSAQQVTYRKGTVQPVHGIDPDESSAWRRGILSFRETALAQVVSEINRYRPGRVMLLGKALEGKPVSGRFNINDLDKAVVQIQRLFHLQETVLPGRIVILS
ncbi:MAG TPA: FecR domain-containing protein [Herbaspirillum sp.]